jgi:hypothetical protein
MRTKQRYAIILALIILMMTQTAPVYSEDSPILQVSTQNIYLKAGSENNIKLVLKNTGDYKIYDIEAFLSSQAPGLTVITKADQVINEIEAGRSKSYEPTLYVDQSVALGAYSLSLTVTYGRSGVASKDTITVPVGVVVSEAYTPKIVYNPSLADTAVKSGMLNSIQFNFVNVWDKPVEQLEIVLNSPSTSITLQDGILTRIDTVNAGEAFSINSTVAVIEGTPLGTYAITGTASYVDEDGVRYHQSLSLPINVASAAAVRTTTITIEEMKIVEDSVLPGDVFTVELTVKCSGADANDLLSSLSFPAISPLSPMSPSIISLGDLGAGETTKVTYNLLASGDISAGQYPVMATISYTNNKGVPKTITETLTVLVSGLIDFKLLDTPAGTVAQGESKVLEADLLLVGTESVQFVSVGVVDDNVVKRVSGSDEYIGAVDPDSPIPFSLNYKVDANAPIGTHTLTLNVTYRDHLNKEHEQRVGFNIDIGKAASNTPQPQQNNLWVWIRRFLGLGP